MNCIRATALPASMVFLLGCAASRPEPAIVELSPATNQYWFSLGTGGAFADGVLGVVTREHSLLTAFYQDGTPAYRVTMNDGAPDGIAESWYASGHPRSSEHYSHGVLHGRRTLYAPDGSITCDGVWFGGARIDEAP